MRSSHQEKILPVPLSPQEIKEGYGKLSRFYAILEGVFEKGVRRKGLKLLSAKPGEEILEIGFGTGYSLKEIADSVGKEGKVYGIDITPEMLRITKKRLDKAGLINRAELYQGDARRMPFVDSKFDAVYMASTLELFDTPDIPKVLGEIKRVLKPNGRLCVASLTKEGRESSLFIRFYEWLHQKFPKYANCRPIYAKKSLSDAGYIIVKTGEVTTAGLAPWELVLAKPKG